MKIVLEPDPPTAFEEPYCWFVNSFGEDEDFLPYPRWVTDRDSFRELLEWEEE